MADELQELSLQPHGVSVGGALFLCAAPLAHAMRKSDQRARFPSEKPTTGAGLIAFLEKQPKFSGRRVVLLNQSKVRLPTQSPISAASFIKLESGAWPMQSRESDSFSCSRCL